MNQPFKIYLPDENPANISRFPPLLPANTNSQKSYSVSYDLETFKENYNLLKIITLTPSNLIGNITAVDLANYHSIRVQCIGPNTPQSEPIDMILNVENTGTHMFWDLVRQRYQFNKIPIDFLVSEVTCIMIGWIRLTIIFTDSSFPPITRVNELYNSANSSYTQIQEELINLIPSIVIPVSTSFTANMRFFTSLFNIQYTTADELYDTQ